MHSMLKVVKRIIRAAGTPLAHQANNLIARGDYSGLVGLNAQPGDYARADTYKVDAQIIALFRKLEGLPTGVDLHAVAEQTFDLAEKQCAATNSRLARIDSWFTRGFHGDMLDLRLYNHVKSIREIISGVLGQIPLDLVPRLSGGSTYYDKGEAITIPHKMSSRPSVTSECWSVVQDLWRETAWARAHDLSPYIIRGNRFTSVPKDSTKNRGICIEPSLNVAYQLAVGAHIRERLRVITGIDIKGTNGRANAQTLHREAAKQASIDGMNATLDLSNASDTVAYMLVKILLPKGWFDLLKSLRSPETSIGTKWVKLHKFSSMGNGFTFELETLLFYAICQAVSRGKVSVYGDDIIISTCDSGCAMSSLAFFGFTVNAKKSFYDSLDPFRESCGGDYFNGEWVRPVFLKVIPASPGEWMTLHNQIRLIGRNRSFNNREIDKALEICVNNIPSRFRLYGPSWADGVLHSEDLSRWQTRPRKEGDQDAGYRELKVLLTKFRKVSLNDFSPGAQLASALLGTPSQGPVPRDGISGYRTAWRPTVM